MRSPFGAIWSRDPFRVSTSPLAALMRSALGFYKPADGVAADLGLANANSGPVVSAKANVLRLPGGYTVRPQNAPYLALPTNVTLTLNHGDGPAPGQRTMRVQSIATPAKVQPQYFTVPAGTYTLSWEGKAAAPVSVKAGVTTALGTFNYTTDWQTFSTTFTSAGSSVNLAFTYWNGAAFDVELANIRVSPGSVDLGLDNSLPFLFEYADGTATPDLSSPEWRANGLIQRHARKSVSGFSAVWQMKCGATAISSSAILWQVSDGGYTGLSVYMTSSALATYLNGSPEPGAAITSAGIGQTVFGVSISDDLLVVLRNGLPLLVRDITFTPVDSAFISTAARSGLPTNWSIGAFAVWDEALAGADLALATGAVEQAAADTSLPITDQDAAYYALGDSITAGNPISTYASQSLADAGGAFGLNLGVGGYTLALVSTVIDRWLPYWKAAASIGKTPIISIMVGYNDGTDFMNDPSAYYASVMAEVARLRSAGCVVIMTDVLPSTRAGHNTARATYNAPLAAGVGTDFDYHCDFSGVTTGTDAAASNVTYYSDGIHPTQAGQDELYPVFNAVLATAIGAA